MGETRSTAAKPSPARKLHDGRSLWHDTSGRFVRTRRPRQSETTEIAIVGGGISGAISALKLAGAGHDVAVFDRRQPGEGSTVASTAMIQFELDTSLIELSDKIGGNDAARCYLRSARAVGDLRSLLDEHDITSHWQDRQALYLAGDRLGFRALGAEAAARRKIGIDSKFLTKSDVRRRYGFDVTGAIVSSGSAELDPARAAAGCLRAAQRLGASVVSPCEIVAIEKCKRGVTLHTGEGGTISARKAIFATGYEVISGVPRDAFEIVSSWAIATKPIAPDRFWPTRCLVWEAADPYLYMRSTHDNRILVGGEDSALLDSDRRAAAIPAKAQKLIRKVRELLSDDTLEVDYAWGGAFADSPTGLPVFKTLPGHPDVFAMLGCGGNGITFSMIGAQLANAWVAGRRDPDADMFDPACGDVGSQLG